MCERGQRGEQETHWDGPIHHEASGGTRAIDDAWRSGPRGLRNGVRTRIREDACALLLGTGYLTEAELGTLSVTEATRAALQRLRGSPA